MSTVIMTPYAVLYKADEIMSLSLNMLIISIVFALLCSVAAYFLYFKILEVRVQKSFTLHNNNTSLCNYFECNSFR